METTTEIRAKPPCPVCGGRLDDGGSCPRCSGAATTDGGISIAIPNGARISYSPDDTAEPATDPLIPPSVVGPRASLSHVGMEGGISIEGPPGEQGDTTATSAAHAGTPNQLLAERPGDEKYVIAGEVGRGGMGVILRAIDRDIRRDVAMKILLHDLDPRARERFVEEAQIAGQLEHPNIIPVHDLGVDADGRLFFTMKLVKGRSLASILAERRTPEMVAQLRHDPMAGGEFGLPRLLSTYLAVLNAIAFAHDRGVIHRDLKPANIMVGDFGEALVMDWGLARVAHGRRWTHREVRPGVPGSRSARRATLADAPLAHPGRGADERLKTMVAGFTAAGESSQEHPAIEGTPAYMAPEQARGELSEIDETSDIYSLGAILYEILTLAPPIRGGPVRRILDDVIAGRILPPSQRAPELYIPSELAAIAMKALATNKQDRYHSVLELRRDIELYRADRKVSAKDDSTWEALVKLVRRNQEVVTAIAVCALIVVGVTIFLFSQVVRERHRYQRSAQEAQTRLTELRNEQQQRLKDQRRAAPALVAKARQALEQRELREAVEDCDLAIAYDPQLGEARVLRAQLAIRSLDWSTASVHLAACPLPRDPDTETLLGLVRSAAQHDGSADQRQIAEVLWRQGAYAVAESLFTAGRDAVSLHRLRLEKQWPGSTRHGFSADSDGNLTIDGLAGRDDVADLSALVGMPIVSLDLSRTQVLDLSPLRRMPLTRLNLARTPVRTLDAINDLRLVALDISETRIEDLTTLHDCPLLELRAAHSQVHDLTPLAGLKISVLDLSDLPVNDLSLLSGMPLSSLHLSRTRVSDLRPLVGMPLQDLDLSNLGIADISLLSGMPIARLNLAGTLVRDLSPLRTMPLTTLDLHETPVIDLNPLRGLPLREVRLDQTRVSDISPLCDIHGPGGCLERLILPESRHPEDRGLRSIPSLRHLGRTWPGSWAKVPPVASFWASEGLSLDSGQIQP